MIENVSNNIIISIFRAGDWSARDADEKSPKFNHLQNGTKFKYLDKVFS